MATDSGRYVLASVGLVVLVILVYFDSLWGVPRYDQLAYLYQAAQFRDFSDLLAHSAIMESPVPRWRPAPLSASSICVARRQYGLFGLRFPLWQAVGLTLHSIQTLLVLRLLRIGLGGGWIGPRLGSALFSTALIGSEMVISHHINGYLLRTILCTVSLIALLNHGATGPSRERVDLCSHSVPRYPRL